MSGRQVLLRNGSVYSPTAPFATAMLTVGDTVAWVGDEEAAAAHGATADTVVDLDGRLVTPTFVDAHAHLAQTGQALQSLDLSSMSTLAEALAELERFARGSGDGWVYAYGWDDSRWPERRPFSRAEVDRAVGRRLAYLSRVDVHSAVVSSLVVDRLPGLPHLDGWHRSGWVTRDAHHAVRDFSIASQSLGQRKAAIRAALREAAGCGVGSVHDLGAPHLSRQTDRAVVAELRQEGAFPDTAMYWGQPFDDCDDVSGYLGLAGDLCADGAIGSRTAALRSAYADGDSSGHLYLDADAVKDHVVACTRAGLQAGFHCIGDLSISTVLEGFRRAAELLGRDAMVAARHRLEHVEMVDQEGIALMAELGIVGSVQPAFDARWGGPDGLYAGRLGPDRAATMNPFASFTRAGVTLAFGSDTPVTPFDPWGGVRAAAYHRTTAERLTVRAAFNAHTRGGHRAAGNDEGGVLAPGAAASYAVWQLHGDLTVQTPDDRIAAWSTDPAGGVPVLPDLNPALPLPTCTRTVVRGVTVFDLEDAG